MVPIGSHVMASNASAIGSPVTLRLVLASTLLGTLILTTLALCVWWAVDRIDARALQDERVSIESTLQGELTRIAIEQDSSAAWDEAVAKVRERDQAWIAENLAEWMSKFFGHDRVYVVAPDNSVVRAAAAGTYAGTTFAPIDVGPVLPLVIEARRGMAEATQGLPDSTEVVRALGMADTLRFSNGDIAFVSIRPILPTSTEIRQAPGTEYLLVSVKLIDQDLLDGIGARLGISELGKVAYPQNQATVTLRSAEGALVTYLGWRPNRPAAGLLLETAPAAIALLTMGLASLVILLTWVRITSIKLAKSREHATYLAMHDPLTGAANRILFDRKLKDAVGYQYLGEAKVLVVAIDIDHFKEINDSLGHAAGDQLLSQVAKRLTFELAEEATLGRLGGDEFAVVQPGVISEGQALWICQRLANALQQPFYLEESSTTVTFSLGIALEEGAKTLPSEILRRADVALYVAKNEGRNRLKLYSPDMDESRQQRRALETDLRNALAIEAGLYLVYQPIFLARSGEIAGAEALVRWNHPTRGHMAPDQFISLAEETGIINQLGLWVLREACSLAVRLDLPSIAVNVSPVQFQDEDLANNILRIVRTTGLDAARLEIEITEGVLLQNSRTVQKTLAGLRVAGIRIALDDFGTGYSSISYLRSYTIDRLKIDRSFTRMVTEDTATALIVRSIIEMADALGISVTAEGIEEEGQRRALAQMGCSYFQGFLLSRPLNPDDLASLLAQFRSGTLIRLFAQTDTTGV